MLFAGGREQRRGVADAADVDGAGVERLQQRRAGGERLPLDLVGHVVELAGGAAAGPGAALLVADGQGDLGEVDRAVVADGVRVGGRGAAAARRGGARADEGGDERGAVDEVADGAGCSCCSLSGLLRSGWAGVACDAERARAPRSRRSAISGVRGARGRGAVTLPLVGDAALVEDEHAVGEREGLVDVVGDEQDRGLVPPPELDHEVVHLDAGQRVQRAERLVEQQQVGLADQRAGERDALGLAAGERRGQASRLSVRPTSSSAPRRALCRLAPSRAR